MTEITVQRQKAPVAAPFVVNITNAETGEVEKYEYAVARLGGRASMEIQMMNADLAQSKDRQSIVGSVAVKKILAGTTKKSKNAPDLLDLFDILDDDGLKTLLEGLAKAARSSSTTEE